MAENNGSLAEVQLTVAVDKKKYFTQLRKMFQDSQTECDANALTVTFKKDRASIENILQELAKYDFSANVTLDSNVEELTGHLKDVLAHMDMSVPITADTSELDKKLAEEKKKLDDMKKNQLKSADEYKKQMQKLAKDTESTSNAKSQKATLELLRVYKLFEKAGGRFGKDDKDLKAVYDWAATAANLKKAHATPIQIFSNEEIEQQIQLVNKLEQEIKEARAAAKSATGTGTGTGTETGNAKVGTEPEVDAEEFAKKVTEQLTTPAKIEVTGAVSNADEFANKITEQLTTPAKIEVAGVVSNAQDFADNVSKQLNVPVNVEVEAKPSSTDSNVEEIIDPNSDTNFYETLKRENQIRDESNTVLKNFNASLKDTAAYLYDVNNQEERMIMLQGKAQVGDTLVQSNGHVGVSYDTIDALRPDTLAHSHQYDKVFNNLRFSTDDIAKATARDFINRLVLSCGKEMLEFDFAGIDPQQREQMVRQMSETYTSVFALYGAAVKEDGTLGNPKESLDPKVYNEAVDVINSMMYEIAQSYGANFAKYNASDFGNEAKIIPFKPVSSTISKYISSMGLALGDNNTAGIAKLQADFAEETAKATKKAASGIDAEAKAAKDAIKWKKEFAKANKLVAESAEKTAEEAKEAAEGVKAEGDASKKAANDTKASGIEPDLYKYLKDIQNGIGYQNAIPFSIAINKEMAEAELKKIAPDIADSFNKNFGTNITGSQVVKAYKAVLKQQQADDEAALQNHLRIMDERVQADEDIFREQILLQETYIRQTADKRKEADERRAEEARIQKENSAKEKSALTKQEEAYKNILIIKAQIDALKASSVEHDKEVQNLQKQLDIQQKIFDQQTAQIKAVNSEYNEYERLNELKKITAADAAKAAQRVASAEDSANQAAAAAKEKADKEKLAEIQKLIAEAEKKAAENEKQARAELNDSYEKSRKILETINRLKIESLSLDKNDIVDQQKIAENRKERAKLYQELHREADKRTSNQYDTAELEKELQLYKQGLDVKYQSAKAEQILEGTRATAIQQNKDAAKAYDKLFKSAKEYYSLLLKETKGTLSSDEKDRLDYLKKEWEDASKGAWKYQIELDGTEESINRAINAQEKFFQEAQNSSIGGVLKGLQSSYDKIQNMIGSGKYTASFIAELSKLQSQINDVMRTPIDLDDSAIRQTLVRLQSNIDETIGKKAFSDVKKAASSSLSKLKLQIDEFTNQNTGMGARFKQQFDNLRIRLTDAKSIADVEKLAGAITKLKSEVEVAGRTTRSFFDILRERIVGLNAQAIAQYFSWQDWIRYIRQMATTVTELDTALTEMRKVSDDSLSSLQAYQKTTFDTADAVGTTALALQQSTADWMRLGEAQEEAAESAKAATVLMNVSEFESIDEATQALVAVSQAYDELDKMDIIDVVNNIGNNFSVATDELAQGLQNAAAVLKTQGNDLNQAVALLTAGNAITQDISKTSAGIRTISLRIAGTEEAKDQLAELGEDVDDFIVQTESKTQKLIKDYTAVASNAYKGIDVLDANGNLRNTYDILLDIAKIYKEIQEEDQKAGTNRAQALVEYIAGKNRSNIAASILLNPDMLENVYNTAIDSADSADKELSKYLESIEGHVARFQTQLQELEFDALDSDTIKTFIDLGTSALSVIDSIIESLGLFGTLGTVAAIAAATRNFGVFKTALDETSASGLKITTVFNDLASALNDSQQFQFSASYTQNIADAEKALQNYNADIQAGAEHQEAYNHILTSGNDALIEYTAQYGTSAKAQQDFLNLQAKTQVSLMAENTSLTNVSSLIQGYNNSLALTGLEQREFAAAVMSTNGSLGQYLINLNGAEASMRGYLATVISTTAKTIALKAVTMGLNALLSMLVSWLIQKAVKAWDNYIHRVENAKKALEEFEDKCTSLQSDLKKQSDAVDRLSDSYFNLVKGVDSVTGKNVSLSSDDYEEFVSTNQELAELFPQLISGVDEYGKYILNLGDNADEARKKLEGLLDQSQKDYYYELYKSLPEVQNNAKTSIEDALKRIKTAQSQFKAITENIRSLESLSIGSGNSFVLSATYGSEEALKAITDFGHRYNDLIAEVAQTNKDQAQRLVDAFVDESDDMSIVKAIQMDKLSTEDRALVEKYFKDFADEVLKEYDSSFQAQLSEAKQDLSLAQRDLNSAWLSLKKGIIGGISFLSEDDKVAESLTRFVNSLPAEISESLKDVDIRKEISKWVTELESLSPEDRLRFYDLFDPEMTPQERLELYKELQANLPKDGELKVYVDYVINKDSDLMSRVHESQRKAASYKNQFGVDEVDPKVRREIEDFFEEMQIDTEEEYEKWLELDAQISDTTEKMKAYREWAEGTREGTKETTTSNLVDAATTLNKKIKPAVDSLAELYQEIFYGDDNKFDASKLDPSQLADIKENFITNLTELGITFEDAEEEVNEFFEVLSDPDVDQTKAQNAFNKILTKYFYAADGLADLDEKTADGLKKMLASLNVTNADEVVDSALNNIKKTQTAIDNLDFDALIDKAEAALESEKEKLKELELEATKDLPSYAAESSMNDIQNKILNGTIQSKYGNVDMDKRTVIHYNDEILDAFKEGMSSWNQEFDEEGKLISSYYDEITEAVKAGDDAIDTVFGGSESFELGGQEIDVAFTPIMVDENGNNPEFLTTGTVFNYIQNVLEKADKAIEESGEEWSEEAVIKKAFEIDLAGMNTEEYDAQGRVVGKTFVHGLIAGIGENAIDIGTLLHFSGEEGAVQLAGDALKVYNDLKERAAEGTLEVTDLTGEEIKVLKNEGIIAAETAQYLAMLALQEKLTNENELDTTESVNDLVALAQQAGIDIAELSYLSDLLFAIDQRDKNKESNFSTAYWDARIDDLKANMVSEIQSKLSEVQVGLTFNPKNTTKDASNAGKSEADAYVEAFEKELEALEKQRDAGIISETEFLEKYKALIEKYFKDVDGYGEEYAERMADYWDRVIEHMENVVSAIGTLLQKKIDAANKGKDAAIDALNEEKDAAAKNYQTQIDYYSSLIEVLEDEKDAIQDQVDILQDQIDALQDANDERQRAITLQKAQYELQRAQNQRTKLIYKDGQMVYENDTSAVRDAKKAVEDAEFDITIAAIQKQIKLLQDEQNQIDKQINAYKEQQEAIQKLLDSSNDYYDNLITQTEKYWDSLIESLEKQKSKWEELVEQKELAEAFGIVQEQMRQLGYTVDDVLNDTPGAFEAFKKAYLDALTGANAGNQDFLDGLKSATGGISTALSSISTDADSAAEALKKLGGADVDEATTKFNALEDAVTSTTKAIGGGGSGSGKDTGEEKESGEGGDSSALTGAIENVKTATKTSIGEAADDASGATAISDFNALHDAIGLVCEKLGIAEDGGEAAEDSLLGIIQKLPDIAEPALLGEGGLKSMFDELQVSIEACAASAAALMSSIANLENAKTFGMVPFDQEATGNVHIGNAYAKGRLGIKNAEDALVGEAGRELIVDSSSGKYRVTNGPELTRLGKGDLVFNAKQTEAIIRNGKRDNGHSYAEGTGSLLPLTTEEMNLFKTMGMALNGIKADVDTMVEPVKSVARTINNTTNIAPVINISGQQFTVQGVTGAEVCQAIQNTFQGLIANAYQRAMT